MDCITESKIKFQKCSSKFQKTPYVMSLSQITQQLMSLQFIRVCVCVWCRLSVYVCALVRRCRFSRFTSLKQSVTERRVQSHNKNQKLIPCLSVCAAIVSIFLFVCTPYGNCAHTAPIFAASFQGDCEQMQRLYVIFERGIFTAFIHRLHSFKMKFLFSFSRRLRAILFSLHLTFYARICWCQNHSLYEHKHTQREALAVSIVQYCTTQREVCERFLHCVCEIHE